LAGAQNGVNYLPLLLAVAGAGALIGAGVRYSRHTSATR
jgi:hypothetical protein